MNRRAAPWAALACAIACDQPLHPHDPAIPDELCEPRCQREHDCDATIDVPSCVNHCEHLLSPRKVYYRPDVVASLRACAQAQTCNGDVDARIDACEADVRRRLEPSAAGRTYCKRLVERSFKCGDYRWDEDHCLYGTKAYTDVILGQLTDCLEQPCPRYGDCQEAVVGKDPVVADRDRMAEFHATPVPEAHTGPVTVTGTVTAEGSPIAGATVCAGPARCTTTSDGGAYTLAVPPHDEVAISFSVAGFGKRLLGLATAGQDVTSLNVVLVPEAVLQRRHAAIGAPYPDDATGALFATIWTPKGTAGVEGMTMAVQPRPDRGPLYFDADNDPDPSRTSTSMWSHGFFAGLKPGEATITFGPATMTCVPAYGGWPAGPNSIRVPVAAGFETHAVVRCHK